MNLKDIKFLGNFASIYWRIGKPSPLTISFLTSFIYTSTYLRIKEEILKEFDLKVDLDLLLNQKAHKFNVRYRKPIDKINLCLERLNLPKYLAYDLFLLIYTKTFIDLKNDLPHLFYARNTRVISEILKSEIKGKYKMGALLFWQNMSKQQLIDWINKNYDNEFKGFKELNLPNLPFYFDKFKDLEICDYIYSLDKSGNNTNEILGLLDRRYPKRSNDFSYEWVLNKLNRYQKRIEKYSKIYKLSEKI